MHTTRERRERIKALDVEDASSQSVETATPFSVATQQQDGSRLPHVQLSWALNSTGTLPAKSPSSTDLVCSSYIRALRSCARTVVQPASSGLSHRDGRKITPFQGKCPMLGFEIVSWRINNEARRSETSRTSFEPSPACAASAWSPLGSTASA